MRSPRTLSSLAIAACAVTLVTACASTPRGAPAGPETPTPAVSLADAVPGLPDGPVRAQGTVLDVDRDVQLCLGAVLESYPPQCSGLPVAGWSWDGVGGAERSGGVAWGAYAVQGTYDGTTFTVTQDPISLALYDPMVPDVVQTPEPGPADEATLVRIQDALPAALGSALLTSSPRDGRLWVQVVWDDGTLQDAADAAYGDGVVTIASALQEVG